MKMKKNSLPAVLLAVITAVVLIMSFGMVDKTYADDGDYEVIITTQFNDYIALPGKSINLSADVYYDFDGELFEDQNDMDFRWELDEEDAQFAKIKVDAEDPSNAKVQFKPIPEGEKEIQAIVRATVTAYSEGTEVARDFVYLMVDSDYYRIYPDLINEYIPVGGKDEIFASLYHYTMDEPDGVPVENVTFLWKVYEESDAKITLKQKNEYVSEYEIERLTGNDAYISCEAQWLEGEETKTEYSDFWLKNIPADLNEYKMTVTLPDEDMPEWEYFVDEGTVITQDYLKENVNVYYDNLLLDRDADYDLVVYKYMGYNEETGESEWDVYTDDLKTARQGSDPDKGGEPTEGTGFFKIAARAKAGSGYTGETDDYAQYIFMYSNSSISGYAPYFFFPDSYAVYLDYDPWIRYDVKPGTEIDPIVKLNNKKLKEGEDYVTVYAGITNEWIGNEFPTEAGLYEAYCQGIGDYYGTSYSQFIKVGKKNVDFNASGKTVKVKASKKKTTFAQKKVFKVSGNKGALSFKKVSGDAKIKVASNGKVTVKKGLKKGKTYSVKVKVTDNESDEYFASELTVTFKVKVTK